ncbi:hypothetical protein PV325_006164 [Microctonus aethiopoides]|uniref:Uncharacterized protein n=1 Tax=Microctonus aethiopoides TaxID=144406 RepID=A0AA39KQT1_9HYME|nr:hypothetical protein PV325_006164 [Microctonus aethiopoides]KAK0096636.1 hypothetical protein PV326_004905 [Microctonus aethiopoides]KAK0170440.1 hypothetical protein PV328_011003 [Microctonus aethiopoides]
MNSKETQQNNKGISDREIDVEESSSETHDNKMSEPGKSCKSSTKIQNGIATDHNKLNKTNNSNNTEEENKKCTNKSSFLVSNGAQSSINDSSSPKNDETNPSSQFKYNKITTANTNIHPINSTLINDALLRVNDIGGNADNDDMRNNVDYVYGINKCPSKVSCGSTSSNPEIESLTWPSTNSYSTECALNNIGGSIGSTSQGTCCFLRPNINGNREIAGPSGLSKRELGERRDSSSGNEGDDVSDGEDYCIYTYKGNDEGTVEERRGNGGYVEDQEAAGQHISGRSSPEMDFLEMDFDPGPSCEQDTGDSDLASINEDIQNIALDNSESDPVFLNDLSSGKNTSRQSMSSISPQPPHKEPNVTLEIDNHINNKPSTSNSSMSQCQMTQCLPSTSAGIRRLGTPSLYRSAGFPSRESHGYHNTSGDLISPGDNRDVDSELWADAGSVPMPENSSIHWLKINLSSTLWHRMMAKKLMLHKQTAFSQSGESNLESELCHDRLDDYRPVGRIMIWSEQEATVKQVTQIATSACGATSAINALLALDVPFSLEVLVKGVATRLREPGTPLPRYLVSRSQAGATHNDIIRGLSLATNGAVVSKFFAFYPERAVSLSHWLHYWISKGAVPITTLNLQNCSKSFDIPDAWHHQMIFGVSPAGIYFTNPLECLPEQFVWHQLVSPSVLLVRSADVLSHWNSTTDLKPLMRMDHRWRKLNVLGQVVHMVRESMAEKRPTGAGIVSATHIRIPAAYQSGITLVMRTDAAAIDELINAQQLPLL